MLQGAHPLRLNEPRAYATSEGFPVRGIPVRGIPVREYFHVSSLNSKLDEIVSKATQMHDRLKSFLKALKNVIAVNESLLQQKG